MNGPLVFVWFCVSSHFVCWNKRAIEEIQTLNCLRLDASVALTAWTRVASSGHRSNKSVCRCALNAPRPTRPGPSPLRGGLAGGPMGGGWGEMRLGGAWWIGALVRRGGDSGVLSAPLDDSAKGPWASQGETPRHPIGQHLPPGRPASGTVRNTGCHLGPRLG